MGIFFRFYRNPVDLEIVKREEIDLAALFESLDLRGEFKGKSGQRGFDKIGFADVHERVAALLIECDLVWVDFVSADRVG